MIAGFVTDDGVPAIDVEVGGKHWRAIIDTGFNGELELPDRLRPSVNARFVGRVTSLLAANQRVEEDVYLVDFPFDGEVAGVQATFVAGVKSSSERGCCVIIDSTSIFPPKPCHSRRYECRWSDLGPGTEKGVRSRCVTFFYSCVISSNRASCHFLSDSSK